MNSLFGPLGKKYCNLFLILSALSLFILVVGVIGIIVALTNRKVNRMAIFAGLFGLIGYLIQYVQNRILYNMCKSI